jgi:intracellular septation protein
MKLFLDFLPLLLFFGTYQFGKFNKDWAAAFATQHLGFAVSGGIVGAEEAPVMLATVVVILATAAQVAWMKWHKRKIDLMLWISLTLVIILGSATVWLHDAMFIKWKPSIAFWVMATIFWVSERFFHRNLLRNTMGSEIHLPDLVWRRLLGGWIGFFVLMGALNLWVAYAFSTDAWANFHTFGTYALMAVFIVSQALYIGRHMPDEAAAKAPGSDPAQGREDVR